MTQFASIEEAIRDVQERKIVIIIDDEDRENEGDLMVAAEKVTPEIINFMATHGRGLICLAMTGQRLDDLNIPLMVSGPHEYAPLTERRSALPSKRGAVSPPAFRLTIVRRPF